MVDHRDPAPVTATVSAPVSAPVTRTIAVWIGATAAAVGAAGLSVPGATRALRVASGSAQWHRVDGAITDLCSVALLAATVWAWTVATTTIVGLLCGRTTARRGRTRRLVLVACGAVLAVSAGPAVASPDGSPTGLDGLPYPDRPAAASATAPVIAPNPRAAEPLHAAAASPSGTLTVVVQPGESLWSIAVRTATPPEPVDAHWRAIVSANPALADPDLVLPGQRIVVPPSAGAR